ncbi:MAG TPA: PDZ domain-containing protein [Candidatus Binataceae bacterium]|nr:PDZ domain-containing protein [Candidatus Binataceae bacterium]
MSTAGASTRKLTIARGVGCALALTAIFFAPPLRAADSEEPATAEVWAKASASAPSAEDAGLAASPVPSGAPSPAEYTAPATAYPLPMTITTPDSGELHAVVAGSGTAPSNMVATAPDSGVAGAAIQEIPITNPLTPPVAQRQQSQDQDSVDSPPSGGSGEFDIDSPDVQSYERAQEGYIDPQQQFGNTNAYTADGAFTTPIGMELCEATRKLASGPEVEGLMVLEVVKGSPAANAGLHPYTHKGKSLLRGAAMAAMMTPFPPVALIGFVAMPLVEYAHVGESYDMIIGVDGSRVTNYLDFEDRMHDVRPGEIVYLSILRNGRRSQMKVFLPPSGGTTF